MPVLLRDDLSEEDIDQMRLVENIQREDLDPLEEAEGFEQLRKQARLHDQADRREDHRRPRRELRLQAPRAQPARTGRARCHVRGRRPRRVAGAARRGLRARRAGGRARLPARHEGTRENRWPTFRVAQDALAKAFNLAMSSAPFDTRLEGSRSVGGQLHRVPEAHRQPGRHVRRQRTQGRRVHRHRVFPIASAKRTSCW
jgi:hypothetical protein